MRNLVRDLHIAVGGNNLELEELINPQPILVGEWAMTS
jgi:hypothetical protein